MIQEVTMYRLVCDVCGLGDEFSEHYAWMDAGQAVTVGEDGGWETEGNNQVCPDCVPPLPDEEGK